MIRPISDILRFNNLNCEINAVYHVVSVRLGISDSAMQILYTVCCIDGNCTITDVCKMTGISKQTINSSLRNLESDGIIRLEKCGRRKQIRLTDKGEKLTETTVQLVIEAENRVFSQWTAEERQQYILLTQKYLEMFSIETEGLGADK